MIDTVCRAIVAALLVLASLLPSSTSRAQTGDSADVGVSRAVSAEIAYVALGDSVAAGIGASKPTQDGYAALVADHLDERFGRPVHRVNLAVPGETTTSMLAGDQLDRALRAIEVARRTGVKIGAVTLTIGANDLLRAGSNWTSREAALSTIGANVGTILRRLDAALSAAPETAAAEILVTGYYDPTEDPPDREGSDAWWLTRLDATLLGQAEIVGARWVDVAAAFEGRTGELTWYPRDIHPTEAGHAVIAEAIWSMLANGEAIA